MTSPTVPAPATTSTGALLPLVALPQGELLTVNEKDIPLVRDALGPGVHFKPLRVDIENGEWVVLATFAPGARIPLHYHTGVVDSWTISGCWYYEEYRDQPQTAGSYLFEPGASVHTLTCPESNTEDTTVLFRISGANVNFTDDGAFHSILDAALVAHLTRTLSEERDLGPVAYITGGTAAVAGMDAL
ncbi:2,4'-dihydroxyacetophenone dioxygenase family protein [Nocardia alba]|uniref:ChrR-like protein with cupin domain n=1 Tax=Nocardia alba TaxID=225051 RepID=A0A4R1FJX2_9NOCA|nr:2,4'-dihydroxyacetophenone dioxygenase family protein [Nocardia alba]TCJ93574.1 ChrR-like protein with cupin domain [Nocardia alba]